MRRTAFIVLGALLGLIGIAAIALPVPLEVPLLASSGMLILRNSAMARRSYVRGNRRFPRAFRLPNRILRRRKRLMPAAAV